MRRVYFVVGIKESKIFNYSDMRSRFSKIGGTKFKIHSTFVEMEDIGKGIEMRKLMQEIINRR